MKEIILSLRRTPYQSLTAFLVLLLTTFLSLTLFVTLSFLYGILGYVETQPQVTAYFKPKTPQEDIFKIRDQLASSGKTITIKYISQEEAFKIYRELNKDNPLLLEMVSSEIFPPSLEIYAKKPIYLAEIAEFLKKQPNIDEVQFQKDIVDKLLSITTILKKISFIFFIFLLFVSIVVLTTTTLFKIALKKEEIELLHLLGATKNYIRKPFIVEGLILAFGASTLSFIILSGLIFYLTPFLNSYLKGISTLTVNIKSFSITIWPINFILLLITYTFGTLFSTAIAVIASLFATNKYLKE